MKQFVYDLNLLAHRGNFRVLFVLATVVLYIIGAAAPDAGGGVGMGGG